MAFDSSLSYITYGIFRRIVRQHTFNLKGWGGYVFWGKQFSVSELDGHKFLSLTLAETNILLALCLKILFFIQNKQCLANSQKHFVAPLRSEKIAPPHPFS